AMWGEGDMLNIMISNPLPDAGRSASHARGNKIAMGNIRERLETQFGDRATLQSFAEGDQYHVKVKIPITAET
ncbi:MAG: hypothetical protein AAB252_05335, partial [Pseudomonadota bacterium]